MVPFSITSSDLAKYSETRNITQSLCGSWGSCQKYTSVVNCFCVFIYLRIITGLFVRTTLTWGICWTASYFRISTFPGAVFKTLSRFLYAHIIAVLLFLLKDSVETKLCPGTVVLHSEVVVHDNLCLVVSLFCIIFRWLSKSWEDTEKCRGYLRDATNMHSLNTILCFLIICNLFCNEFFFLIGGQTTIACHFLDIQVSVIVMVFGLEVRVLVPVCSIVVPCSYEYNSSVLCYVLKYIV